MTADKIREAWLQYYASFDAQRTLVGDPYRRHVQRKAARERALLILSGLVMVAITAAFATIGAP
jgi:hypothetical protein